MHGTLFERECFTYTYMYIYLRNLNNSKFIDAISISCTFLFFKECTLVFLSPLDNLTLALTRLRKSLLAKVWASKIHTYIFVAAIIISQEKQLSRNTADRDERTISVAAYGERELVGRDGAGRVTEGGTGRQIGNCFEHILAHNHNAIAAAGA